MTPEQRALSYLRGGHAREQLQGFIAEAKHRGDAECVAAGMSVLRDLERKGTK
jgi:hypothetical protein